jgi:hydrophobe/amphiphile efflux-3 (HAE3) family protein
MWQFIVRLILRYRLPILVLIGLITIFMGWKGSHIKMSYQMASMLPADDPTNIEYQKFKKQFGQDGSVIFVAIQDPELFTLDHFDTWYDITKEVTNTKGVAGVISAAQAYLLTRNDSLKKFVFKPIINHKPTTQREVDSVKNILYQQKLYNNRLFNKETNVNMMMITLDKEIVNSKKRIPLIKKIKSITDQYNEKYDIQVHYSGLPYIRTITTMVLQKELLMFTLAALIIASILLFLLFKSFRAVFFSMLVVIIAVIWALGTVVLFGYKITILTGILPPLLIVIGVENSIFLLNKYLTEYREHGNKVKALSRMISRIGNANLLTNATTAVGFAAFVITGNHLLVEFGIIAALNIFLIYLLSLFMLPILFSYFPEPKPKHLRHLEKGIISKALDKVVVIVQTKRQTIYIITSVLIVIGIIGITKLKTTGNIVDDISKDDILYKDLIFMEKNFKGVMPLEITINTEKPKGVLRTSTLLKIDKLQKVIEKYPEFSEPLSIVEVIKAAKQAFYRGNPKMYSLPNSQERNFIFSYVPSLEKGSGKSILNSFVDTNLQITRVSVQMANIGTNDIERILKSLKPKVDSIFPPSKYEVHLTGTSVVFLKGTNYLVKNLFQSLLLAVVAITLLMALIFSSARMILISLIPNIIPQILTAGMMGYFGITIKPSTILIFSVALGISVDNTIHFLSRYRLHLKHTNWQIKKSVLAALHETGYSMIYSATVLFFGFSMFTFSSFGGTEALGYLVSFTLLVALFSNLFVLPSLLLTIDKRLLTKSFKEPMMEVFDEEEDIELDQLIVEELEKDKVNKKEDKYKKV